MAMTLEEALKAALDDEYRARATYRAVVDAYGPIRPFVNIVESEERHIRALQQLCERYDVKVPADPWPSRVSPPESLEAACKAALEAEQENVTLYEQLMRASAGRSDVEETFRRENHQPAFQRALERERRGAAGGGGRRTRRRHRGGRSAGAGEGDA